MKHILSLSSIIILIAFSIQSCEIIPSGPDQPNEIELVKKSAELIKANQQFAFEIFNEVCTQAEEDNLMISPLSISYALGMTYNGAAGSTLDAFNDVLHFDSLTVLEVNESYKDLMEKLIQLDKKVEMSIANGIWYREGEIIKDSFIHANQEYFDAAIQEMDFTAPDAVDIINGWIEDKTNDKIKDMLDNIPSEDAYMYLINAVYFNAKWKYEFDTEDTWTGDFKLADNSTTSVDYMHLEGTFAYAFTEDFSAIELPYGDSAFSMVIMLPSESESVNNLAKELDVDSWNNFYSLASPMEVTINIPKFTYEYKCLLNEPLIDLGLEPAFNPFEANFTRMTTETEPWISRVIHQTFIDVMEEGTEAAAATIVEMVDTAMPETLYFNADRPFIYLIKENSTGAIIFIGKVGKPEYE